MNIPARQSRPETKPLLGLSEDLFRNALQEMGTPPFRAVQVMEWIYRHGASSFEDMNNLPKTLRAALSERFHLYESSVADEAVARDGTRKLLLRWADAQSTECVLIPEGRRRTACLSTQVGCPIGCTFCASGLDGVERNLTVGQIVEQALRVRWLCEEQAPLSNVVFMGLGEPLANYRNTVAACRILNAKEGLDIGARRITVSTVGLPARIRRLADEGMQVTLALSLHAPTDELRRRLIPRAEGVTIQALIESALYFFERTGREVTIEYVLLGGVNDSPAQAVRLARICRMARANVNLICYNPVAKLPYKRPDAEGSRRFLEALRRQGINAHLRRSRGAEIDGACGQLRRRVDVR